MLKVFHMFVHEFDSTCRSEGRHQFQLSSRQIGRLIDDSKEF